MVGCKANQIAPRPSGGRAREIQTESKRRRWERLQYCCRSNWSIECLIDLKFLALFNFSIVIGSYMRREAGREESLPAIAGQAEPVFDAANEANKAAKTRFEILSNKTEKSRNRTARHNFWGQLMASSCHPNCFKLLRIQKPEGRHFNFIKISCVRVCVCECVFIFIH